LDDYKVGCHLLQIFCWDFLWAGSTWMARGKHI